MFQFISNFKRCISSFFRSTCAQKRSRIKYVLQLFKTQHSTHPITSRSTRRKLAQKSSIDRLFSFFCTVAERHAFRKMRADISAHIASFEIATRPQIRPNAYVQRAVMPSRLSIRWGFSVVLPALWLFASKGPTKRSVLFRVIAFQRRKRFKLPTNAPICRSVGRVNFCVFVFRVDPGFCVFAISWYCMCLLWSGSFFLEGISMIEEMFSLLIH